MQNSRDYVSRTCAFPLFFTPGTLHQRCTPLTSHTQPMQNRSIKCAAYVVGAAPGATPHNTHVSLVNCEDVRQKATATAFPLLILVRAGIRKSIVL